MQFKGFNWKLSQIRVRYFKGAKLRNAPALQVGTRLLLFGFIGVTSRHICQ